MSYNPGTALVTTALDDGSIDHPADARAQLLAALQRLNLGVTANPYKKTRNRVINACGQVLDAGNTASISAGAGSVEMPTRYRHSLLGAVAGAVNVYSWGFGSQVNGTTPNCVAQVITTAMTNVTGTNGNDGIQHKLDANEVYDLSGKQVTVSFWFKSNVTGTYPVALRVGDTTGYAGSGRQSCVQTFTYATAGVAQFVSLTFPTLPMALNPPAPASTSYDKACIFIAACNTGSYQASAANTWTAGDYTTVAGCVNWMTAVSNYVYITMLQLEEGPYASEFEAVPYASDVAQCQRYIENVAVQVQFYASAAAQVHRINLPYKVSKRNTPVTMTVTTSTVTNASVGTAQPNSVQPLEGGYLTLTATAAGLVTFTGSVSVYA